MSSRLDTLPGCIGYYPKAVPPNKCRDCQYIQLCRKIVSVDKNIKI